MNDRFIRINSFLKPNFNCYEKNQTANLNFKREDVLSRENLKLILGGTGSSGGTCGYWYLTPDNDYFTGCNVTKSEALAAVQGAIQYGWCCDSCKDTDYCG